MSTQNHTYEYERAADSGHDSGFHADVAVVGAGPIGLEVAGACRRLGISALVFDAQQIGQTIYDWPEETRYFSSPERMAVAGIPMQSTHLQLGSREEYLAYLRSVVEILDLDVHPYERVTSIEGETGEQAFSVHTQKTYNSAGVHRYRVRKVVVATGDMAKPHKLGIPGEDLPHVSHFFDNPHRYFRSRLLIVGGRNSAVECAIRAWRAGAAVDLSYRRAELENDHIYSRNHLEISLLTKKKRIGFHPETQPVEIRPGEVLIEDVKPRDYEEAVGKSAEPRRTGESARRTVFEPAGNRRTLAADFVYLATGYEADTSVLSGAGVQFDETGTAPQFDEDTMETTVPGLYIAGTAIGGNTAGYSVFVGTCHDQAVKILTHAFGIRDAGRIVTGSVRARNYPFSRKDIEPE
jgi:thioredoxin reductase (NADPH)